MHPPAVVDHVLDKGFGQQPDQGGFAGADVASDRFEPLLDLRFQSDG
jgi:hypothetical protein